MLSAFQKLLTMHTHGAALHANDKTLPNIRRISLPQSLEFLSSATAQQQFISTDYVLLGYRLWFPVPANKKYLRQAAMISDVTASFSQDANDVIEMLVFSNRYPLTKKGWKLFLVFYGSTLVPDAILSHVAFQLNTITSYPNLEKLSVSLVLPGQVDKQEVTHRMLEFGWTPVDETDKCVIIEQSVRK